MRIPLIKRVAVAFKAESCDQPTCRNEVLSEVVHDEATIIGLTEQHHVAGHRDQIEPPWELHPSQIIDRPLHVWGLTARGVDHVGIKIDTGDIEATSMEFDRDTASAATGIEYCLRLISGDELGLAMNMLSGRRETLEPRVVTRDVGVLAPLNPPR